MIQWIKGLFSSGDSVKKTLGGIGDLAKDIKTIATGKLDPERAVELMTKVSEIETTLSKIRSSVLTAEAQGNFLQKSWRPICMLTFLVLTILNQFNLLTIQLSDEVWSLFKLGLGGYIGGRSLEKIVNTIKK